MIGGRGLALRSSKSSQAPPHGSGSAHEMGDMFFLWCVATFSASFACSSRTFATPSMSYFGFKPGEGASDGCEPPAVPGTPFAGVTSACTADTFESCGFGER